MNETELEALKYPIGKFKKQDSYDLTMLRECIKDIEAFPELMRSTVSGLTPSQLDTPYREGGWTVRQLVHHCSDSNLNSLCRFKLALTEDNPTIKPYKQDEWVKLADSNGPIEPTLLLLDGVHVRWGLVLRSMSEKDFSRTYYHPEQQKKVCLNEVLAMYAWHGKHHLAHIQNLVLRMNW